MANAARPAAIDATSEGRLSIARLTLRVATDPAQAPPDMPGPVDIAHAVDDALATALDHGDRSFWVVRRLRIAASVGDTSRAAIGGAIALLVSLHLCEENSGRLKRLILIDSGGYNLHLPTHLKMLRTPLLGWLMIHLLPPKLAALTVLKDSYYDDGEITNEQIETYARPIGDRGGRHALLETSKQIIPEDYDELIKKYPRITVPTLIIWGRQDKVIPLVIGEMLDDALPDSKLVVIDHAGHIPQEETPEFVVPLVLDFLRS